MPVPRNGMIGFCFDVWGEGGRIKGESSCGTMVDEERLVVGSGLGGGLEGR